eukprot:TRINITY_DN24116_c0_g1_i1.p1 TRINITY_DN24116_c0_g1~~TRINITY_DN24116_c0_g1_i1.p1  ORF type:complete len:553 (-),score=67.31 TRINITY_DN24116_c0_g1_i1:1123-2781(-)
MGEQWQWLRDPGDVDGVFAVHTCKALQTFLASNGCNPGPEDGRWSDSTAKALQRFLRLQNEYQGEIDGAFPHGNGDSVKAFQRWLGCQGFDPGAVDGNWGGLAVSALQRFLKKHSESQKCREHSPSLMTTTSSDISGVPYANGIAEERQQLHDPGEVDGVFAFHTCKALQIFLASNGCDPGPEDGRWSESTAKALQRFLQLQAQYQGEVDGIFLFGNGDSVKACQRWLESEGFDPGPIDGNWGRLAVTALQRFLKEHSDSQKLNGHTPSPVMPRTCSGDSNGGASAVGGIVSTAQAAATLLSCNVDSDVLDIAYKPLADFIKGVTPEKSAERYFKEDVLLVASIAQTTGKHWKIFIDQARRIVDRILNDRVLDRFPGLEADGLFALVVYSMQLQSFPLGATQNDEFYYQYGQTLRRRQAQEIRYLAGYSHFLFGALQALPKETCVLWRGIRSSDAVKLALDNYQPKAKAIHWCSFSFATVDRDVAVGLFADSKTAGLLFRLEVDSCSRDISQVSALPSEKDRLILPNTRFIVSEPLVVATDGMREIHLQQIR